MDSSPRDSPSKRAFQARDDISEGQGSEKRPRIGYEVSEVSEQEDDGLERIVADEKDGSEKNSPPEVIYELSSDNDDSFLQKKSQNRQTWNSNVDEVDGASKDNPEEKRKRLVSSDYITKTMEDLEDLQEDLHKELAEITEKSQQTRKHKKGSLSKDKRHKEKMSKHMEREERQTYERIRERRKEKEREKPKERGRDKQKSTNSRGSRKREVTVAAHKGNEKGRKHHEVDEKPWSYESRRARSQKDERREHGGERHWMQMRQERPPSRTEVKSVVERKVQKEPKAPKEDESQSKEPTSQAASKESGKESASKKGIMSDSMRELVLQSLKESKSLAQEVVEEEEEEEEEEEQEEQSDENPEQLFKVHISEVSSASEEEFAEPEEPERLPEVPRLPPYLPAIQGCRSVEEFQWLNRIEEGTYGVVYRAKDKRTNEVVALKKLKMEKEKEGFPITSLREINTLLKAQHPNIVTVQEIVVGNNMDKIYIVMDFVEHDLKALMETMTQPFLAGEIKTIMIQLLRAVNHLHDNWILHRDIKTSNLLLSNKGILKVGDFGLAREYGSPLKSYTPIVVTLWYRAPELLLGAKEYSTPIDVWSVGCVFAELLTMKPLFNGQSEISQINKIFKELGTPSDKIWPGPPAYSELPATKKMNFAEHPYNNLRNRFGATLTDNGFDLLNSFLTYDPNRRITAESALQHDYFKESPSPVDPSLFPSWPARSEGAKRAKKASPKAPEGGNFYKGLSEDGDGAFHMPAGKSRGKTAVPWSLRIG